MTWNNGASLSRFGLADNGFDFVLSYFHRKFIHRNSIKLLQASRQPKDVRNTPITILKENGIEGPTAMPNRIDGNYLDLNGWLPTRANTKPCSATATVFLPLRS